MPSGTANRSPTNAAPCCASTTPLVGVIVDREPEGKDSWYVDLVTVEQHGHRYTLRDLYIDVIVPTDGRHYRMVDLDEFADGIDDGLLNIEQATDALLPLAAVRYLHPERAPVGAWTDFPPVAIRPRLEL